jgi:hypothetical protein
VAYINGLEWRRRRWWRWRRTRRREGVGERKNRREGWRDRVNRRGREEV